MFEVDILFGGDGMPRLNVVISESLRAKLQEYIIRKYGVSESFYGKISEVVRIALEEFLERELKEEG